MTFYVSIGDLTVETQGQRQRKCSGTKVLDIVVNSTAAPSFSFNKKRHISLRPAG